LEQRRKPMRKSSSFSSLDTRLRGYDIQRDLWDTTLARAVLFLILFLMAPIFPLRLSIKQ
jgi:hypothetical protein